MPRFVLVAVSMIGFMTAPLTGQQTPAPVAPGSAIGGPVATQSCPTFHWALVEQAEGYDLAVYGIEDKANPATSLEFTHEALALQEHLPMGVGSWTPSLDRCLDAGRRYAWTVRAVGGTGAPGEWAEPRYFMVREPRALERLLDRVVHRMLAEGELSEQDAAVLAAWGLGNGADLTNPNALASGTPQPRGPFVQGAAVADAAESSARQTPAQALAAVDAVFQVDGTGHERGVYAVGKFGVWGESDLTVGARGVYGRTTAVTGGGRGVQGRSDSTEGVGVFGWAPATTGATFGVSGQSDSPTGTGVYGFASADFGASTGVYGESASPTGYGVHGKADTDLSSAIGVFGESNNGVGVRGTSLNRGVTGIGNGPSGTGVLGNGKQAAVEGFGLLASGYDFYASGAGTDYGPFTGGHEVRLAPDVGEVAPGMVVVVTGEAQVREENGSVDLSSTLPTIVLSTRANNPAVLGVLVAESKLPDDHWYEARDDERFAIVNALGEGRAWVTDANGPVRAGDYLTTSDVPGFGQRQDDDHLRAFTLGKAIETVDWDLVTDTVEHDGRSYKKVLLAVIYTSG